MTPSPLIGMYCDYERPPRVESGTPSTKDCLITHVTDRLLLLLTPEGTLISALTTEVVRVRKYRDPKLVSVATSTMELLQPEPSLDYGREPKPAANVFNLLNASKTLSTWTDPVKPGKYYTTRDGRIAKCEGYRKGSEAPYVGNISIHGSRPTVIPASWTLDGFYVSGITSGEDLLVHTERDHA